MSLLVKPHVKPVRVPVVRAARRAQIITLEAARSETQRRRTQRRSHKFRLSVIATAGILSLPTGGAAPSVIAGLSPWAWLKAGTGFYTDAGTTPATTTGDLIRQWSDQSGNNRHLSQATSGNRPTLAAAAINGLDVANFAQASAQYFTVPSMAAFTQGEIYIAVKVDNDPPASRAGSGLWNMGTDPVWDAAYPFSDGIIYDDAFLNSGQTIGNPTPSLSAQYRIYHVVAVSAGNQVNTYLDNSLLASNNLPSSFTATPYIGRTKGNSNLAYLSGRVAEFVAFSSELSSTNRGNVVTDIKTRLGI